MPMPKNIIALIVWQIHLDAKLKSLRLKLKNLKKKAVHFLSNEVTDNDLC